MRRHLATAGVVLAVLPPAAAGAHGLSADRAQHRAERTAAEIALSLSLRSGKPTAYNVERDSCVRAGSTGHRRDCMAAFDQGGRSVCTVRVRVRFRDPGTYATMVYAVDRLRC